MMGASSGCSTSRCVLPRALAIRVTRKIKPADLIDVLADRCVLRNVRERIRSGDAPEFIVKSVQVRVTSVSSKTFYFAPSSALQNVHIRSLSADLRGNYYLIN